MFQMLWYVVIVGVVFKLNSDDQSNILNEQVNNMNIQNNYVSNEFNNMGNSEVKSSGNKIDFIKYIVGVLLKPYSKFKEEEDNLDYTNVFNDIFDEYVKSYSIESVKTVNLGSLFEITYMINMKKDINEKKFIDDIRCRNGNLKIILTHQLDNGELQVVR